MKRVPKIPKLGPLADVVYIVLSIEGLVEAIAKNSIKGIIKNSVAIVGAIVTLSFFALGSAAGSVVGVLFYLATVFIGSFWPNNKAIKIANKLSYYARQELDGLSPQLQKISQKGTQ